MALARGKALLHLSGRIRRVVDTDDIYHLEAQGEVLEELSPLGFVRIHPITPDHHTLRRDALEPGDRGRRLACEARRVDRRTPDASTRPGSGHLL